MFYLQFKCKFKRSSFTREDSYKHKTVYKDEMRKKIKLKSKKRRKKLFVIMMIAMMIKDYNRINDDYYNDNNDFDRNDYYDKS